MTKIVSQPTLSIIPQGGENARDDHASQCECVASVASLRAGCSGAIRIRTERDVFGLSEEGADDMDTMIVSGAAADRGRRLAVSVVVDGPCELCGQRLGYDRKLVRVRGCEGYVHATCVEAVKREVSRWRL